MRILTGTEEHKLWLKKKKKQPENDQVQENTDILGMPDQNKLNNDGFQNPKLDNTLNKGQKTVAFASQNESISAKDSRNDSVVQKQVGPRGSIYKQGYSQFCKDLFSHNQDEEGRESEKMRGFTKVKAILE